MLRLSSCRRIADSAPSAQQTAKSSDLLLAIVLQRCVNAPASAIAADAFRGRQVGKFWAGRTS